MPAGVSVPGANMLDDDDEMMQGRPKAPVRRAKSASGGGLKGQWKEFKGWMQGVPRVYTGERLIHLNNRALNVPSKFLGNSVSTSKYNPVTFLPKFLFGA